ncbi:hypothetical protein HY630_02310 [Candidatus Uhrbacteria bacterium]|nr:hypothetical protein [Candidatus Uhrbacteria bacterium]
MSSLDSDLFHMDTPDLQAEIRRLREAIRRHRDERAGGRCWQDDRRLYTLLPERDSDSGDLPPLNEFLHSAESYWWERHQLKSRGPQTRLLRRILVSLLRTALRH